MLVETNGEEQQRASQHPWQICFLTSSVCPPCTCSVEQQSLQASSLQLGHHGHQCHVEEDTDCGREQPGGEALVAA